ncbi:MAG: DNA translocase FtsK 4TM domain-containing protein [Coriobacteriia bacterium]|nr:DNA translocase FtsK 4TM domain-containing protein [Coriobacteriia bacterium]
MAGRTSGSTPKRPSSRAPAPAPRVRLDDESRRDIYGIALCALAIALMIAVLAEDTGVAARAVANVVRLLFGIGAYAIPVAVLLWGVSFFVRAFSISEGRVGGGLALLMVAAVSMIALASPQAGFWEPASVADHGGYLGGAFAWALRSLLGQAIAYVALAALMLIGLVVTGWSVSGAVQWLGERLRGDGDEEPGPAPRRRTHPADRTLPLEEMRAAQPGAPAPAGDGPGAPRTPAADPESGRATLPGAAAAPKALEGFELPPASILATSPRTASAHRATERELRGTAGVVEATLATFDIPAKVTGWVPGPTVTMFEVRIAQGVKVGRITALADDLALALAAPTIRVLAPIPGKSLVGIEVPNDRRSTVTLGDVLAAASDASAGPLTLAVGKDVTGDPTTADLAVMPHLLIAGATGTGKSVCINALLVSILMRATPAEVRLILIDPKRIELNLYNGVPHLYVPVVTEPKEAASALAWAVSEMDSRLKRLQKAGARNIAGYNGLVQSGSGPEGAEEMPYLVIVIDELADLMMVAAREVEDSICRLAQLARAAGIHLIVATQRPSTDIITGLIKTNITHRIAFAVSSSIDSRVILDQPGAEKLVGAGDMLFSTPAWPKPKRIQGAFVSEGEIGAVVEHLRRQAEPEYHEEILHLKVASVGGGVDGGEEDDPLLWEAADIVVTSNMGSTSMLQRRLKVGYARAGRIMDMLEAKGVVGPPDGSKPREVLVDVEELEALKAFERREAEAGEG